MVNIVMTHDQLTMLAFVLPCQPLLTVIQKDKIKRVNNLIDDHILHIELYYDTFSDINFTQFLENITLCNLDITMKIIGKSINMFIHLPK